MQHLIVKTPNVVSPKDPHWLRNSAGHKINPKFGFGALNAGDLVREASSESWRSAMPQRICETPHKYESLSLKKGGTVSTKLTTDGCENFKNHVTRLEHVLLIVTINKRGNRGKLDINLVSPSGTKSAILRPRVRDQSTFGFWKWAFLTVFHWDEDPKGNWTLEITDSDTLFHGELVSWRLKFHGTRERAINEAKICNDTCKQGCPVVFSDVCYGCSQYCDCTTGQCVYDCGDLVADNQLSHCKLNQTSPSSSCIKFERSLYTKFAFIILAFITINVVCI